MAPTRHRRPGFSRRAQYSLFFGYLIAVGGAAVAVVLLVLAAFDPPALAALRGAVGEITTPVSTGAAATGSALGSIPGSISEYIAAGSKNAELRRQIAASRTQIIEARSIVQENHRLKALLSLREGSSATVATARLVSSSASSTRRFAVLNAGRRQGVVPGQPVRAADGLVGRILEAGPSSSRVLLLGDPESIVPVRRTRDGFLAIAQGRGDGGLDLRSALTVSNAFKRGDIFVTSGAGGLYAPNIPVARVIRRTADGAIGMTLARAEAFDFAIVQTAFVTPPPAPANPTP